MQLTKRIRRETPVPISATWGELSFNVVGRRITYVTIPAAWPRVALIAAIILFVAAFAQADEFKIPRGFQIPAEVSQPATPSQATVIVQVSGHDHKGSVRMDGVGTILRNGTTVLTCGHLAKGVSKPVYSVKRGTAIISARVLKHSAESDLALLEIDAEFPGVELAETNASGQILSIDQKGWIHRGTVVAHGADSTFTNQRLVEGDSGCGLFVDGKLAGVFSGIAKDGTNRRLFANLDEIQRFIDGESKAKSAPKVSKAVRRPAGWHTHHCRCGHSWSHGSDAFGSVTRHTCSKCGRIVWH